MGGIVCDSNFQNVALLVPLSGANGGTTFVDSSLNAYTVTETNATTSNAQQLNGANTGHFPGGVSGSQLSVPFTTSGPLDLFTTGPDFTIEAWIFLTGFGGTQAMIISWLNPNSVGTYTRLYVDSTGHLALQTIGSSMSNTATTGAGAVSTGSWYHVAGVRHGSAFTVYVNGVAGSTVGTGTGSASPAAITNVTIGGDSLSVAQNAGLEGYISNVRVTNGLARYTANFTPPSPPLPLSCFATVPNVVGMTRLAAIAALTASGFLFTVTELNQTHPTVPVGSVVSQNPAAGTVNFPLGGNVIISVSVGPALVAGNGGDQWGAGGGSSVVNATPPNIGNTIAYAQHKENAIVQGSQSVMSSLSSGTSITQNTPDTSVPTTPQVGQ